jgi:hypothetical protein
MLRTTISAPATPITGLVSVDLVHGSPSKGVSSRLPPTNYEHWLTFSRQNIETPYFMIIFCIFSQMAFSA